MDTFKGCSNTELFSTLFKTRCRGRAVFAFSFTLSSEFSRVEELLDVLVDGLRLLKLREGLDDRCFRSPFDGLVDLRISANVGNSSSSLSMWIRAIINDVE